MISSFSPPTDRRAAAEFMWALLDGEPRAGVRAGDGGDHRGDRGPRRRGQALFDTETRKPVPAPHRVCELAGEIRKAEAAITKIIATLDPGMTQAKSARHQYAANVRWHGGAVKPQ
jgi:hypothetical protein